MGSRVKLKSSSLHRKSLYPLSHFASPQNKSSSIFLRRDLYTVHHNADSWTCKSTRECYIRAICVLWFSVRHGIWHQPQRNQVSVASCTEETKQESCRLWDGLSSLVKCLLEASGRLQRDTACNSSLSREFSGPASQKTFDHTSTRNNFQENLQKKLRFSQSLPSRPF